MSLDVVEKSVLEMESWDSLNRDVSEYRETNDVTK